MPSQRPGSVTAAGVLAIIYGSLFTLCGLCAAGQLAAQGMMGGNFMGGGDPRGAEMQKQLQDALERDVPGFQAVQIGGTVLGLAVAVALLIAGIGLLYMKRWARALALVVALVAIASTILQAIYQVAFVMPAMSNAFAVVLPAALPPGPAGGPPPAQFLQLMKTMMTLVAVVTVIVYVVIVIYLFIIVFLLQRRHVRAAFADQERAAFEDRPLEETSRPSDDEEDWQPRPRNDPDDDRIRE